MRGGVSLLNTPLSRVPKYTVYQEPGMSMMRDDYELIFAFMVRQFRIYQVSLLKVL